MRFRPMPGFTVLTLIMLAILLSLGTWQYQRLQWKTDLLADIEAAAQAAPFTSLSEVNRALEIGNPVNFRRIELLASSATNRAGSARIFYVYQAKDKSIFWREYSPFETSTREAVFVAGDVVKDSDKGDGFAAPQPIQTVAGYVRTYQEPGFGSPKSTPSQNRYFSFNAAADELDWAGVIEGRDITTAYYIDRVTDTNAADLPPKRPDIRNNHFDYMLTWYSFALILLVIYTIMHIRAGRLTYGARP